MIELMECHDGTLDTGNVGSAFRRLRKKAGLSMEQIALEAGLHPYTIASIETGRKTNPQLYTITAVLKVLGYRLEIVKDD